MVCNRFFFILSDFYFTTEPMNTNLTKAGYAFLILSLTAFFYAVEIVLDYRTYHVLTMLGLLHVVLSIIFPRAWLDAVAVSIAFVTLAGVTLFMHYTISITSGEVRRSIYTILIGFLMGYFGFIFAGDMAYYGLGEIPYLFGEALLVVGLTTFGLGLIASPALDELDWQKQLVELYIIQTGGLLVFHQEFEENAEIDQVLTAAGISGVQSMFQEITRSDTGLNVVSVGEFEILFAHSESFTSVLIAREPYQILLSKVNDFTKRFEEVFGGLINTFEGSFKEFSSASEIVAEIF